MQCERPRFRCRRYAVRRKIYLGRYYGVWDTWLNKYVRWRMGLAECMREAKRMNTASTKLITSVGREE